MDDNIMAETKVTNQETSNEGWITPSYQNGWVDYGSSYGGARYMKDAAGIVHLKGLTKSGTVGSGVAIFTLPSGYRPDETLIFVNRCSTGHGEIRIDNAGAVTAHAGSSTWMSLSNIHFVADR